MRIAPCLVPAIRRSKRKLADIHAPLRDAHAGASRWRFVMAGLVPAIHVFPVSEKKDVDARHKAGHDEFRGKTQFHRLQFESTQEKWRTSARPPNSPAIESTTDPIT